MRSHTDLARSLTESLGLVSPRMAVRYVRAAPDGLAVTGERPPAGCALWRRAEKETFFAAPAAHRGCAVYAERKAARGS